MGEFPDIPDERIRRARWPAWATIGFILVLIATLLPFLFDPWHLRTYASFALFLPTIGVLISAVWFLRTGARAAPRLPLILGCVFIVSGIAFDVFSTMLHSPDLELEGNRIARYLLDSGYPVGFVYAYGSAAQTCVAVAQCLFWAAFLKHLPTYLESSYDRVGPSFSHFLKSALGGRNVTWREFFFSPTAIRRASLYHLICSAIPFCVCVGSLYRWYLGLHWWGQLSDVSNLQAILVATVAFFAGYAWWLFRAYRRIQRRSIDEAANHEQNLG
jgi:hypothetical protein